MRLYSGTSRQLMQDCSENQIAGKLQNAFFGYFQYNPSPAEVSSWKNSLRALCLVFGYAGLNDHGVILEYQLPLSSFRIDCIICGKDSNKRDNAVLIELKQWDKCEESDGENEVLTYIGGGQREVLHPSVQVGNYKLYLEDTNTAFNEEANPIVLNACSYLHNYEYFPEDVIFAQKFNNTLKNYPLFTADDSGKLSDYLVERMEIGKGSEVLQRIENSKYKPSKKLMDHVARMIKNSKEYILLDEQQVIYDRVLATAKQGFHDKKKTVIIAKGGPGTGKSVIAINLMADLLAKGYNAQHATGTKAFTNSVRHEIGTRGSPQFRFTNNYVHAESNDVDVLICDEAHRIKDITSNRFTPKSNISGFHQIEELLNVAKCSVFFIDDLQVVRPNEIGSSTYIKDYASKHNCKIFEYELEAQFRCAGSDAFVNWVSNTLGISRTANVLWDTREEFDFKIFENPFDLENAIKEKAAQGDTARIAAGFCWKWSDPDRQGNLIDDVVIGDYKRPWNAKGDTGKLAPGIPRASRWSRDPNGINQIGCIYTAQGFEYDYIGVIVGKDLIYDFDAHQWRGQTEQCADSSLRNTKDKFVDFIKKRYRVLLSRGMKGCYVYFQDKDAERFVKSRIAYH